MGYYIQGPNLGKAQHIVHNHQGQIVDQETAKEHLNSEDKAVIVVVHNGLFEAAGLAYSQKEFEAFTEPDDTRPKQFVIMPKNLAHELSDFKG